MCCGGDALGYLCDECYTNVREGAEEICSECEESARKYWEVEEKKYQEALKEAERKSWCMRNMTPYCDCPSCKEECSWL